MPQTPPCVACGEPLEGWEGHSCYKCVQGLAEQRDDLFDEVMKLRYENKILKEGLPIEKANKNKRYLTFDIYGEPRICSHIDLCWQYDVGDMIVPFDSGHRLYPLPSTETQMEGE